jgi:hypothetical protein
MHHDKQRSPGSRWKPANSEGGTNMAGTPIFINGRKRLVRDGDRLIAEVAPTTDSTGALNWVAAPQEEVEGILRDAVLHFDNERRDKDQEAYDRAESESLRRARERQR